MLGIHALKASYGKSQVLHGVDLTVAAGEIVGLLGRNGSGRSTTLKALMGLVSASGSVQWRGEEILGDAPHRVARRGLGYVPENRDVFPRLTVAGNLALGVKTPSRPGRWRAADIYRLFPALAMRRDTEAGVLSGGEQQMLSLGRALMGNPELLLVDEPTEGLAPMLVDQVAGFLLTLKAQGVSVLLVEQKLQMALRICDRCCVMGHGEVVFEGPPAALLADSAVQREWLAV